MFKKGAYIIVPEPAHERPAHLAGWGRQGVPTGGTPRAPPRHFRAPPQLSPSSPCTCQCPPALWAQSIMTPSPPTLPAGGARGSPQGAPREPPRDTSAPRHSFPRRPHAHASAPLHYGLNLRKVPFTFRPGCGRALTQWLPVPSSGVKIQENTADLTGHAWSRGRTLLCRKECCLQHLCSLIVT